MGYSQTYLMDNTSVTTCSGTFYDSGNSTGDYSNNENFTKTFSPGTAGMMLEFVFNSFRTRDASDYLVIYDGPNTGSPIIGTYSANTGPGTVTATNTGDLTFVFVSDGSNTREGWDATINCVAPPGCGTAMTCATVYSGTLGTVGIYSTYPNCTYSEPGEEHFYSYTPPLTGSYTFTTTTISGDPDYFLMSTCDNTGTNILGSCWGSGNQTLTLTAGVTYYVIVDNYYSSSNSSYEISVSCPICAPVFTLADGGNNCPLDEYYIDVDITSLGTAASVFVSNDGGFPTITNITTTGIQTLGPFPSGTTVNVVVENEANSSCTDNDNYTTPSSCPPANDLCANATSLPCGTTDLPGTTNNAVEELPNNGYSSNYGVWYTFTGDGNQNLISSYADFDHEIVLYSGNNCSSLTYIDNVDLELSNDTESLLFSSTLGTTYYVYIAQWSTSSTITGDFTISRACITPPANDECAGAISLTVNPDQSCTAFTSATTSGGTDSGISACVGTGADDDVWFSFTATSSSHEFSLYNISGSSTNMVLEIFAGNCGSLSSIACSDPETSTWGGFTVGQTYYVRVHTYNTGDFADFDICIGTPPPPPSNDDPCGATPLVVNIGSCAFQTANLDVSTTATPGVPAPGCGSLSEDIWFTATVPASGRLIVDISPNGGPTDFDMAFYTSSTNDCNNIDNLIECDSYDSQNGSTPMICRTGALCTVPGDCQQNAVLTPGETVYIRVWEYGGGSTGAFDICAYEPSAPGLPSNCGATSVIASLPFSESNTTCCRDDDYTSADGCASSYQDGEDFMYEYTPSSNETIDITLTGTTTFTGIFITDRCPDHPSAVCVANTTSTSGNPMLCGVNLTGGTTYYIMIDTEPGPTCTPFNIIITEASAPTCGLNYSVSSIAYAPDLNNGSDIALPIDDRFSTSYIPIGFDFCFDGFQFNQLLVSSNGYVIFDPIGCSTNQPSVNAAPDAWSEYDINMDIPNTTDAPRNCIMFPYQDINPATGGTIKYQTLGTSPNRRFVLTYYEVPYFSCTSLLFTGQLKLFEGTNDIEVHLGNKEVCSTWNDQAGILGLHNYNGTIAVVPGGYNYSSPWTASNEAWKFTCNCVGCVVLPVELVEFTGEKISTNVNYLKWATATEFNSDYFDIERRDEFSNDFVAIDKVEAAGNSNELIKYSYTDNDAPSGAAYYRLKQVDKDGKYKYSSTIVIGDVGELADINTVYPNPASDMLNVKLNSDGGEIKISLVAMSGQEIILEENASYYGFNEVSYNVSDVPSGVYYLKVSSLKNEVFYKEKIIIE